MGLTTVCSHVFPQLRDRSISSKQQLEFCRSEKEKRSFEHKVDSVRETHGTTWAKSDLSIKKSTLESAEWEQVQQQIHLFAEFLKSWARCSRSGQNNTTLCCRGQQNLRDGTKWSLLDRTLRSSGCSQRSDEQIKNFTKPPEEWSRSSS